MKFTKEKFSCLTEVFEQWWAHKLERPIIQVTLIPDLKAEGDLFTPDFRRSVLDAMYDMEMPPEEVAECVEAAYEKLIFLGDAFPVFYMRPTGILGGYLGQPFEIDHQHGTVWFEKMELGLEEIAERSLDLENRLFVRSVEITKAVQNRFDGRMAIGFPDLGGICDILSSIRDPNVLLLDLCDNEAGVKRALSNIHMQFIKAYDYFDTVIDTGKIPGYSAWASMLSKEPYFVLQNDFSAMIGPDMYDEYYLPILRKECRHIPRTMYHLDGPEAVRHLDSILSVDELDAVQWINGAGAPGLDQWPDLYKKIIGAGKLCQVFINGSRELWYIDEIIRIAGTGKGFCFICNGTEGERDEFERYLRSRS
ncbi:MAG: hypothetical protein IJ121_04920 [Eubacterium sp.]|nr:hypothetical protein [Eubacterium sp.]